MVVVNSKQKVVSSTHKVVKYAPKNFGYDYTLHWLPPIPPLPPLTPLALALAGQAGLWDVGLWSGQVRVVGVF